jgi:uncharacterized protein (TIGR02186 family)
MNEENYSTTLLAILAWGLVMVTVVLAFSPWAESSPVVEQSCRYCALSKDRVCIDSTYTGDSVTVSGLTEPGAEVIVKVSSPPADLKLSRKGRVGPIWMNVASVDFDHAPAFYQVNCSQTLNPVLSPEMMSKLGLGYQGLRSQIAIAPAAENTAANYTEFISLKESQDLYGVRPHSVRIDPEGGFQTAVRWPSNAPPGPYDVMVYQVKNGQVVRQASARVNLEKVGLTRWLADLARDNGAAYGLLAVASALGAGLVVGFVFKGAKGH